VIELDPQKPFAGRYHVVRRIAAGGMGAVFEVVHVETQRRRALKVMLPELVTNSDLRERFQMEARVTGKVDSDFIVDVFDAGIDPSTAMPFLVMELLQGEELGEVLKRGGAVAAPSALMYLRQIASALDKTHAAGIVHRDLKPENIFLTHREDGTPRIKILDFGIAKVVSDANTGANATRSLGTPLYMAPEQVLGQNVSPATDLYSLGLIAYTLLVGLSYWLADTEKYDNAIAFALHTTKGTRDSAVGRAAQAGRSLPSSFDAWFQRATHLEPAKRYQRASELVSELAVVLGSPKASALLTPRLVSPSGTVLQPRSAVHAAVALGTAPGTELDRQDDNPAVRNKSSKLSWLLGMGVAGAVAGGAMLRGRPDPTAAIPSAASPASSTLNAAPVLHARPPNAGVPDAPPTARSAPYLAPGAASGAINTQFVSTSARVRVTKSAVAAASKPQPKPMLAPSLAKPTAPQAAPGPTAANPYTRD
jgi:eukaryotic-like serine/threonine-protein kinase